jgi:6-pyruvoyltetrahydropterin/6-carboxytetrahydropterin synthase
MLVTKFIEIDMGHRVTNHKSKCSSLHGHRYKVEVGVDDKIINTPGISDEGMVIDFGDIKSILMQEVDAKFDHGYVLWEGDRMVNAMKDDKATKLIIVDFIPTAENLSRYWYNLIKPRLEERKIAIKYVKVWETPTSTAIYTKEDEMSEKFDPAQMTLTGRLQ